VNRNAFYAHFRDKADCFIALCDEAGSELLGNLASFADEADWVEAARKGLDFYLRHWQDRPVESRAYFVELPMAGERAVAQREREYARFRVVYEVLGRRARAEQPDLPPLSSIVPRILVSAVAEFVGDEVRAGRVGRLTRHAPDLLHLIVRLLADDATANSRAPVTGRRRASSTAR
jgi:AcrR family transcriptional regulator